MSAEQSLMVAPASSEEEEAFDGSATCEIGSLEMPPAEWLFSAAASFQQNYGQVHPYLAAGLCIAGTLMNLVTVLVLTRPSMRSPVNVLLCAVACCDIMVESSYLVFVLHFLLASAQRCEPSDFSKAWAVFMMFHAHASVIFHAASIWMTVSLAQIRVLTIRRATTGPTTPLITERFTAILAVLTTLAMTLVNVPNFLTFEIMEVPASALLPCWQPPELAFPSPPPTLPSSTVPPESVEVTTPQAPEVTTAEQQSLDQLVANLTQFLPLLLNGVIGINGNSNHTHRQHRLKRLRRNIVGTTASAQSSAWEEPMVYTVRAHESDCMKLKLAFWSNGMIFKVIPCLLLTLSIVALLRIIAEVSHKRKNLAKVMKKKVPQDHTTPMLAAILIIFLLAELPQGVFLVLNGIYSSESFHKRVYLPLGDLMDLLSLLNSAVGFLIYVAMSRKFRSVFLQLLFSALGCIFRAELCLAPILLPLLNRARSKHQPQRQNQRSIKPTADTLPTIPPVPGLRHSFRRLQQRFELEEEGFSDTLKLLDTRGHSEKIRKCSTPQQFGRPFSEKLAGNGNNNQALGKAREAMKLRSMSTDYYGAVGKTSRRTAVSILPSLRKRQTPLELQNGTAKTTSSGNCYKTPCTPGIPPGKSTDAIGDKSKSWRRTSASCGPNGQQHFHSGFHYSEQPSGAALLATGGRTGGNGKDGWRKCQRGRSVDKTRKRRNRSVRNNGWMHWRKLSRNTRSTELTGSRTEQLSLCPSSLLGLPPLTLAVSCSAGITAAAATVGVHLLQLDPPSSGSEQAHHLQHLQMPEGLPASASSSFLILPNPNIRRPSSESQMSTSSQQQYLHVPGVQPSTTASNSSILLPSTTTTKRASFLSLCNEQQEPIEGERRKRISFNLPASEYQKDDENVPNDVRNGSLTNGHSIKETDVGFGQRLRRSFLLTLAAASSRAAKEWVEEDGLTSLGTIGDNVKALNSIGNGDSDCPGKALLKMQKQHESSTSEGTIRKGRKLSSAIARALLTKLAAAADIKRQVDPEKMDSTGSSESVQRKMCALKTETNFAGWAAYC